jgi:hypothetical protein
MKTQQNVQPHIPGQSMLDVEFALLDALGQAIHGSPGQHFPYLIKGVVCPSDVSCGTLEECSKSALQPLIILSLGLTPTQTQNHFLAYCPRRSPFVTVHFFFSDPLSPHSVTIACSQCEKNQKMRLISHPTASYTCESCEEDEYVVDPTDPAHICRKRARGMVEAVPGSNWSKSGDMMRLSECPVGYLLRQRKDCPVDDRCELCNKETYSLGVKTSSTLKSEYQACIKCPDGGDVVFILRDCLPTFSL